MTEVKDDLIKNNETVNWIPESIGKGRFAVAPFLKSLREQGFDGAVTLELYRSAFSDVSELAEDYHRIGRLIARAEQG